MSTDQVILTPEEIIEWLEAYRRLMIEVYTHNPPPPGR